MATSKKFIGYIHENIEVICEAPYFESLRKNIVEKEFKLQN